MYNLKIFDNLKELWLFLIRYNIKDYSFKSYQFEFKNINKINYFLSYKLD